MLPLFAMFVGVHLARAEDLRRFEFSQSHMGTPFRIVLYASDETQARQASDAAYARVREIDLTFSDYNPESEVSRLSRTAGTGQEVTVSPDLWGLLDRAIVFSRASNGAFDVTVGPLTLLWRQAKQMQLLPAPAAVSAAVAQVGYEKIHRNAQARTVVLSATGMRLDFGTIAKGYATDQAVAVLRHHGSAAAFVSGGGDTTFGDPPPGRTGWRVVLGRTDLPGAPPERIVLVANAAVATSGDLFQRLEIDGVRYSHLLDPRTGHSLTDHSLVSVIAPDCVTANGLSTSVSVLGPDAGLALVDATPQSAALVLRCPAGKVESRASSRLPDFSASEP